MEITYKSVINQDNSTTSKSPLPLFHLTLGMKAIWLNRTRYKSCTRTDRKEKQANVSQNLTPLPDMTAKRIPCLFGDMTDIETLPSQTTDSVIT